MIDNTALLSELYSIQESYSVIEADIDQTSKRCVIDVKERTISVPKEIESLGVQYDHRSYRLLFEIDRYIHNVDLLTQTCVIQWLSKNGTTERSGLHPIVEIESIDNDKLLFVWELYEDETRIPGTILFAVNFYTMKDENSFLWSYNTLPAQSIIQDTLDVVINPSDEITPSLLMVWNDKMSSIEKLARDSISTSIRSAQEAEAWAHGRTDFPNTILDNAKYYKDLTQALYDEAKDALSDEKDRVVEEAKNEIVNLAKDEVIAVVKEEVTNDVINDVYAVKEESITAINDATTVAIQEVVQTKDDAIDELMTTGDERYAVKESIPTKVSELENDSKYLTEVPEAPVKSVNGKTGDVDLSAEDVGAVASKEFTEFKVDYENHSHTAEEIGAATSEEVSQLMSDLTELSTFKSLINYCDSIERSYDFFILCEQLKNDTSNKVWVIPNGHTLYLDRYVAIPQNTKICGGSIVFRNYNGKTYQAEHGGLIIVSNNVTFDNVNITIEDIIAGTTVFVIKNCKGFKITNCNVNIYGTSAFRSIFYYFGNYSECIFDNNNIFVNSNGTNGAVLLISNIVDNVDHVAKNCVFKNSFITSNGGDELIAIMSQTNRLENIVLDSLFVNRTDGNSKHILTIFTTNQTTHDTLNSTISNVIIKNCIFTSSDNGTLHKNILRVGMEGNGTFNTIKNCVIENCVLNGNIPADCYGLRIVNLTEASSVLVRDNTFQNDKDTQGRFVSGYGLEGLLELSNNKAYNLLSYDIARRSTFKNNMVDDVLIDNYGIISGNIEDTTGYITLENNVTLQYLKSVKVGGGEYKDFELPKKFTKFYGAYASPWYAENDGKYSIVNGHDKTIRITNYGQNDITLNVLVITK